METENQGMPIIKREDGYTTIEEVEIGLFYGLCTRPCCLITKQCMHYQGEVRFRIAGTSANESVSGKSIMGLMTLEPYHGRKLTINIEGIDEKAEELALRLYSGITTRNIIDDYCSMYFNRLERVNAPSG